MEAEKRHRETLNKERCLSFAHKLWELDTLAMFHHAVSATEAPGYYDIIKSPIDLSAIIKNIKEGEYTCDADVEDAVALMISNALEFNEKGSVWYNQAKRFHKEYLGLAKQSGLALDADAAFIPTKKARDDESTLSKAEKKYAEKLDDVIGDLEKEKDIPLEELRKKYSRDAAPPLHSSDSDESSTDNESNESDTSDSYDSDSYDEDDDDEDDDGSSSSL